MTLTPSQAAALKAAIDSTPAWAAYSSDTDGNIDLAVVLNATAAPRLPGLGHQLRCLHASRQRGSVEVHAERHDLAGEHRHRVADPHARQGDLLPDQADGAAELRDRQDAGQHGTAQGPHKPAGRHHRHPRWRKRRGWLTVKAEMEKCRVLCANCHRIEHAESRASGDVTMQVAAAGFYRAS